MNKMSMTGLIVALIILGILFFFIGFLVASSFQDPKTTCPKPPISSWLTASKGHANSGLIDTAIKKASTYTKGMTTGALGGGLGSDVMRLASQYAGPSASNPASYPRTLSDLPSNRVPAASNDLQNIPIGLRPFAQEAYDRSNQRISNDINRAGEALRGPFRPQPFGHVPPPSPTPQGPIYQRPIQPPPFAPQSQHSYEQMVQTPPQYYAQPQPMPSPYPSKELTQYPSQYAPYPVYPAPIPPSEMAYQPSAQSLYPPYPPQGVYPQYPPGYGPQPLPPPPQRFVPMG